MGEYTKTKEGGPLRSWQDRLDRLLVNKWALLVILVADVTVLWLGFQGG